MPSTEELVADLTKRGRASLPLTDGTPSKHARTRLLGAARAANVRVTIHRVGDDMVAAALGPAQAKEQAHRSTIFRAVNHIRRALEVLTTEVIDPDDYEDDIADLKDIADELEESVK